MLDLSTFGNGEKEKRRSGHLTEGAVTKLGGMFQFSDTKCVLVLWQKKKRLSDFKVRIEMIYFSSCSGVIVEKAGTKLAIQNDLHWGIKKKIDFIHFGASI